MSKNLTELDSNKKSQQFELKITEVKVRKLLDILVKYFSINYSECYFKVSGIKLEDLKLDSLIMHPATGDYVAQYDKQGEIISFIIPEEYTLMSREELKDIIDDGKSLSAPKFKEAGIYLRNRLIINNQTLNLPVEELRSLYDEFFTLILGIDKWYESKSSTETFKINFSRFIEDPSIFR